MWACAAFAPRLLFILVVLFITQMTKNVITKAERKSFAAFLNLHGDKLKLNESQRNLKVNVSLLEDLLKKSKFQERELVLMNNAMEKMSKEKTDALREVLVDSMLVEISFMIGKGGFGEVHLGKYNNSEVAVKRLIDISEESIEKFRFECFLMKNLRHPNIVKLVGVVWDDNMLALLLEYVPNGTLGFQLHKDNKYNASKNGRLTWKGKLLKMTTEMALGVQYLHDTRYFDDQQNEYRDCIIHRDLKPDNMLVTNDWSLKVTDFGSARAMDLNHSMTQIGTRK